MPLYEYRCDSCHKTFETIQKFSDAPLTECLECGKTGVQRLISKTSFQLKGTGWYQTDYKKSNSAAPASPPTTDNSSEKATPDKPSAPPKKD